MRSEPSHFSTTVSRPEPKFSVPDGYRVRGFLGNGIKGFWAWTVERQADGVTLGGLCYDEYDGKAWMADRADKRGSILEAKHNVPTAEEALAWVVMA